MNEQVSTELLVLRTRANKTLLEVAEAVKIDPATLSRYEHNKSNISIETLEVLLNYYNEDAIIFFKNVCANMHK